MRIIVTRPEEDATSVAAKLKLLGHVPIMIPLMKIVPRIGVEIPSRSYQLICLSSANGVRSLPHISGHANVPLVAVGEQSLRAAVLAGFIKGIARGGDIDGLHTYITTHFRCGDGPIAYISGSTISGDLEGKLASAGFNVDRIVTYDAVPMQLGLFKEAILNADAVLLYSPRAAKMWLDQITRLNMRITVSRFKHFCLSPNVAAALPQLWVKCIASVPTEKAMLELLD